MSGASTPIEHLVNGSQYDSRPVSMYEPREGHRGNTYTKVKRDLGNIIYIFNSIPVYKNNRS